MTGNDQNQDDGYGAESDISQDSIDTENEPQSDTGNGPVEGLNEPQSDTGNGSVEGLNEPQSDTGNGPVEGLNEPASVESTEDLLRQELESAVQQAHDNLELAQHTQAEMENLRKRTLRDVENAHKFSLDRFVNELLPVIDSLELGIQASESANDVEDLIEGMNLTLNKFNDALEKFGVFVVDPQEEKFNPDRHDAVSMTDTEDHESGTVITVLQKGYELNGRLVRPAMVVVAK